MCRCVSLSWIDWVLGVFAEPALVNLCLSVFVQVYVCIGVCVNIGCWECLQNPCWSVCVHVYISVLD
jgi:hypothetical protein